MRHVVITGGSRGIGFGLVREFLLRGLNVTFCGTTDHSVMKAMNLLTEEWSSKKFRGVVCDVSKEDDLLNLWEFGTKIFGEVDIWINNAGIDNPQATFNKLQPSVINRLIDINIKGLIHASHIAYNNMLKQGKGSIYNMGGLGSDGRMIKGLTPYGMSKRAVQYFTKAFARETGKESPVIIGLLLPGMVLTDMLLDPIRKGEDNARRLKRVYNLLAEEVEPVASYLADRITSNEKNGAIISYSGSTRMFLKIPGRLFSGRDIVSDKLEA
ncbi:MAG TPA: SDR family oxidoreductase [Bacteroidetes bacterium]|nr:SDR family oxidoreductase [Bacteroidota bacterium]